MIVETGLEGKTSQTLFQLTVFFTSRAAESKFLWVILEKISEIDQKRSITQVLGILLGTFSHPVNLFKGGYAVHNFFDPILK